MVSYLSDLNMIDLIMVIPLLGKIESIFGVKLGYWGRLKRFVLMDVL